MSIVVIDSHCHLNFPQFNLDREEIISQAQQREIGIINIGCDLKSSQKAVEIAEKNDNCWATVGIHPTEARNIREDIEKIFELGQSKKVVAIGEIGLDYFRQKDSSAIEIQKKILKEQIKVAQELNKPIVFHCREAHSDLLKIVKEMKVNKAEIHCFDGNLEFLREYLKLGFFIGFTGIITYSSRLDKIIQETPLEALLIETDAPYLSPIPHRGKRNSPLYLKYIAQKISQIKKVSLKTIYSLTLQNNQKLFKIN